MVIISVPQAFDNSMNSKSAGRVRTYSYRVDSRG